MRNELFISGPLLQKIQEYADSGNTPFYIYDTHGIQKNCREFLSLAYTPLSVHYAMMANINPEFLRIIKSSGLKIFVNSLYHMQLALDLNFEGDEIVFAASAMDKSAMYKVQSCGARLILDSVGQLELWKSMFPGSGVGIRCNIGELVIPQKTNGGYFIGSQSRLGLTIDEVMRIKGDPCISGLHIYVGTNISEIDHFIACYQQVARLAEFFPHLEYLDFGGGFGSGEKNVKAFDLDTYSRKVTELMNSISSRIGRKIRLILEPGRIIGADAGFFVCKITDIKKGNHQQLIGVDASSVQFPRPLFYPEDACHPVLIKGTSHTASETTSLLSSIYGCSTYSRDYLARNVELPEVQLGDLVILGKAGSYCSAAHTCFLGFPKAEEYFI
jgi:diaminopimelate decarboxylase